MARPAGREGVKHSMDQLGGPNSDNDVASVIDSVSDNGVETAHLPGKAGLEKPAEVGWRQRSSSWCATWKLPLSPFDRPPSRRWLSYLQTSIVKMR